MLTSGRGTSRSTLRLLDALALAWCAVWLALGIWVGRELWQLAGLGETLARSGSALDSSGRALQELREIPIIGQTPGRIGDQVRATAADVVTQGNEATGSARRLAVLLGLTVALLPLTPALLYLPLRLRAGRDRREVRDLLSRLDEREVDAHLARRALQEVPYPDLLRATATPERDFAAGRHRPLADLELSRLGLGRAGDR